METSRWKPRYIGLAALLLALLLVQSAFSFSFRRRANLSPRMLYHNLGSFVSLVLTGSRHIAGDLELLYQLRQLAAGASQPEKPLPYETPSVIEPKLSRTAEIQHLSEAGKG